ncbi:DUF3560 domain-containing protein (plasmid) [Streptomyces sp. Q6]|uniref:DUF3560 domain-containing protein n=1 Tax=Streptomyces citrinus TaxID=3118173 RepID=A0ACD5AQY5_9ACTN
MAELLLTHTRAEGTRLTGTAPGDGAAPVLHALSFRLARRRGFWFVPRSRGTCADERLLARTAEALRADGHTVTVTVDDDQRRSFAAAEADRTQAAARRAERYTRYRDSAAASSQDHLAQARRMLKSIPPGQPILIDHYSANREIRFRERMRRHFETGHRTPSAPASGPGAPSSPATTPPTAPTPAPPCAASSVSRPNSAAPSAGRAPRCRAPQPGGSPPRHWWTRSPSSTGATTT